MDDFKYIWISVEGRVPTEWPVMFLVSERTVTEQDEDDVAIRQVHELIWEIQNTGPDPDELKRDVWRRVRAVDAIIRSMTSAQLTAGMAAGHSYGAMVDGIDHEYDVLRGDGTIYMRAARLKVLVSITEVQ